MQKNDNSDLVNDTFCNNFRAISVRMLYRRFKASLSVSFDTYKNLFAVALCFWISRLMVAFPFYHYAKSNSETRNNPCLARQMSHRSVDATNITKILQKCNISKLNLPRFDFESVIFHVVVRSGTVRCGTKTCAGSSSSQSYSRSHSLSKM